MLIRELTRRVNIEGIFQAAYTAGKCLPRPVSKTTYWHRSLQPKKLIEVGFSHLAPRMTMMRTIKLYALPDKPQVAGFRKMTDADCEVCCHKLNAKLRNYKLAPQFTLADFKHWILTSSVVCSYVVEDAESHEITDMVSFYLLPSAVLKCEKHSTLNAAYNYYYFNEKTPLKSLLNDALIEARNHGNDVYNMLNLMENMEVAKDLKFLVGDGNLHYYLYNWRAPIHSPGEVGLVLL